MTGVVDFFGTIPTLSDTKSTLVAYPKDWYNLGWTEDGKFNKTGNRAVV